MKNCQHSFLIYLELKGHVLEVKEPTHVKEIERALHTSHWDLRVILVLGSSVFGIWRLLFQCHLH